MFNKFFLLSATMSFQAICFAQNGPLSVPYTLSQICPQSIAGRAIPVDFNDSISAVELRNQDSLGESYRRRSGVIYHRNISTENSGIWDTLTNNDRIWRMTIRANGATGLTLSFETFDLIEGASLHLYNGVEQVLGTFNHFDNTVSGKRIIWFPDSIVTLELYEPNSAQSDSSILQLSKIGYHYRLADSSEENCYHDVACNPEFSAQAKSVAKIIYESNEEVYRATGFLVNNACKNGSLLFISAFHNFDENHDCVISLEEESGVSGLLCIFNYERLQCDSLGEAITGEFQLFGASILATSSASDMVLLKLTGTMPDSANPFLAGWDIFDLNSDNQPAYSIHHAHGFYKKISIDADGIGSLERTTSNYCADIIGTTQWYAVYDSSMRVFTGSSGSPLFNSATGKVIGVMSSFTGDSTVCPSPFTDNDYAFYGRLSHAFQFSSFDVHLSPPEAGQGGSTQLEGMFFSERNNTTCSATNGGPDCVNPYWATCFWDSYTYPVRHIEGITYNAGTQIYYASQGIITGYDDEGQGVVVPAGANISYRAHDFIELGDGFTVEEGGQFESDVGYCCTGGVNLSDQRLGLMDLYSRPLNVFESTGHFKFSEQKSALFPNPTTGQLTL